MLKRAALAAILIGAAFGALAAGRIVLLLLVLSLSLLAAGEFLRLSRSRGMQPLSALGLAGVAALLIIAHARTCNAWKGVERPSWITAWQPYPVEAINKHAAAAIILVMHHSYIVFTVAQCLDGGFLRSSACAHNSILVNL